MILMHEIYVKTITDNENNKICLLFQRIIETKVSRLN